MSGTIQGLASVALLDFDDHLPTFAAPMPAAEARWLKASATAGFAAILGLSLTWGLLAPAAPERLNTEIGAADLLLAADGSKPEDDRIEDEIGGLYAGIEGPDDARYAGIDTQVLKAAEGDTLSSLLQSAGATRGDALAVVAAIGKVYDPRQIKQGFRLTVTLGIPDSAHQHQTESATGRVHLMSLAFKPDVDKEVIATRSAAGTYSAELIQKKLTAQIYRASGVINDSLFLSAGSAGVPDRVTSQLMLLFSYDVDFQRDIHSGDSFEVFFPRYFDEHGNAVKSGDIMFAALTLNGERKALYRHARAKGRDPEYFDETGKSIKRSLLRTPMEQARVSSGFGMRRHPILGYSKMHKGIDFAATTGTPILASGDGTIEIAGRTGGYGNYVRIRHNDNYETAYGHMSAYGRGIKEGVQVMQGQVIGYVGSTGMSTGPHLHYEILINGEQINPSNVKLDTNQPLSGADLEAFVRARNDIDVMMANTPLNAPVETSEADTLASELRGSR